MVCPTSIFRAENSVKFWAAQFKLQKQVGKKRILLGLGTATLSSNFLVIHIACKFANRFRKLLVLFANFAVGTTRFELRICKIVTFF